MNEKVTVLYQRLSKDDIASEGDSKSIINQRDMLVKYAEQNGYTPYICLSDDGKTGTNFLRPGWAELMELVEADKVGAIILKSLDRMGRNYLEAGMLREMFAEKGIRLIAINDGVDTFDRQDDFIPFREIMAEYYARDTSRKIKSVLKNKGRDGKPLSNIPPYGFVKDPQDKTKWQVDPIAAAAVRRIFNLAVEGNGPYEISRILHNDKVERPSYYSAKNGLINSPKSLETDTPYSWKGNVVSGILAKPEYAGHTVNFRTTKPSYKTKHSKSAAPEEWLIFPNTHEAIVPQETWDLAQKCRDVVRRTDTSGEANPLTGLLFCAQCGSRMYNNRSRHRDMYSCASNHLRRQRFENKCSGHYVATSAVREILLDVIRKTAGYVREHEAEFVEKLRESSALAQGETVKSHTRQIAKNERRIAELDKLFRSLYEDKVNGSLTAERFASMSAGYEQEQADLRDKNVTLQAELDAFTADGERADKFIKLVQKYTRFEELTPALLLEFVDKVYVHEGVWSEQNENNSRRGSRTQQIDVYLNYIGRFDTPDERTPEQIEAERIAEEKLAKRRAHKREYQRQRTAARRAATVPA